jgi:hypothetical protein
MRTGTNRAKPTKWVEMVSPRSSCHPERSEGSGFLAAGGENLILARLGMTMIAISQATFRRV